MSRPKAPYRLVETKESDGSVTLSLAYRHPAGDRESPGVVDTVQFVVTGLQGDRAAVTRKNMERILLIINLAFENGWNCALYGADLERVFDAHGPAHYC